MIASVTVQRNSYTANVTGPGLSKAVVTGRATGVRIVYVGMQGLPGASANSYTHTQSIAAAIWTVAHNLARRPSITVVDNLDRRIEPDVAYLDANTVQITHASALIGKVYCN